MESERFISQFPAELLCTPCRMAPPPFERASAFGIYANELRTLVHHLKYERMQSLAKPLGSLLAQAIEMLRLEGEVTAIAVPLFPSKERQRGYNQSVLLADEAIAALRKRTGLAIRESHSLLRRVRDTESQYALNPRQRRTNLRGAFAVSERATLSGRTVLLIDDIYTTGATARECARILRRAGAKEVFIATLARAQAEQVERWDMGSEHQTLN